MTDPRRRRLKFRAWRRGFKEMDLILGGFADAHLETLSPGEVETFESLLEESDQDIYEWIVGRQPTPDAHDTALLARLRDFHLSGA